MGTVVRRVGVGPSRRRSRLRIELLLIHHESTKSNKGLIGKRAALLEEFILEGLRTTHERSLNQGLIVKEWNGVGLRQGFRDVVDELETIEEAFDGDILGFASTSHVSLEQDEGVGIRDVFLNEGVLHVSENGALNSIVDDGLPIGRERSRENILKVFNAGLVVPVEAFSSAIESAASVEKVFVGVERSVAKDRNLVLSDLAVVGNLDKVDRTCILGRSTKEVNDRIHHSESELSC